MLRLTTVTLLFGTILATTSMAQQSAAPSQLDFAGLGRIAGDVYQAVEQAIGIFCTLPVMR
jgi:hypothetical protein